MKPKAKRKVKSSELLSNFLLLVSVIVYPSWRMAIFINFVVIVIVALLWSVIIYHIRQT